MWSGLGPLNKTANLITGSWLENKQDPDLAEAKVQMQAVATELSKAFRGVGALSEKEIGDWKHDVSLATTPESMRAAIGGAIKLANGRIDALQSHWDKT